MKRLLFALLVMVLCTAYTLPPALPSSFWGYVSGMPAGAEIGAYSSGVLLDSTSTVYAPGYGVVYALDAEHGSDGALVVFKFGSAVVGYGIYHTGTNQRVDLTYQIGRRIRR
jgi:hypothetical protein